MKTRSLAAPLQDLCFARRKFAPMLPCSRGLQIVYRPEWKTHVFGNATILVAGAAEVLSYFV